MIPHKKEEPTFNYTLATELQALQDSKALRNIPQKTAGTLMAATWNLTNFGVQDRTANDLALMAEIISWFDLIAVQEVADDLGDLRRLVANLPTSYHIVISDIGGNRERAGFIYDSAKVARLELAAEIAIPPSDQRYIRMKGVSGSFHGFDRNPYIAAFRAGTLEFMAVSAHLFFGSTSYINEDRRALEAFAMARWAWLRNRAKGAYSQNILIMGDLNLPKRDNSESVYRALKAKGLILPEHSTKMGSNLAGDREYDQVGFHAGGMKDAYTGKSDAFDFEREPFFADAFSQSFDYFKDAVKYHIADHRPLWAEFNI